MIEADTQRLIELVPDLVRTVLASRRRIINNIPRSSRREEARHILPTALARRRREAIELPLRADDRQVMEFRRHEPGDEASEGI